MKAALSNWTFKTCKQMFPTFDQLLELEISKKMYLTEDLADGTYAAMLLWPIRKLIVDVIYERQLTFGPSSFEIILGSFYQKQSPHDWSTQKLIHLVQKPASILLQFSIPVFYVKCVLMRVPHIMAPLFFPHFTA